MDFSNAIINGIPLVLLIAGLVAFAKTMGLQGKALTILSAGLGLVFGAAFQISEGGIPVDFDGWFGLVIYGLGLGIGTSGMYDLVKRDLLGEK
jgi:hypothetical protein